MLVQKGFKYRLKPTKEQKQKLLQHGGNVRFVYNYFLKQNIDYYNKTNKFKFYYELATSLPKLNFKHFIIIDRFDPTSKTII
ncbi:unnamed protein product [marine sediment metagenome]|uniref:Transposase putative helix-turn-helix domain-containing protein n=1 Tax=marine sediment metagenome TaxID=412755 RepID=X1F5S0_9ZZZZ